MDHELYNGFVRLMKSAMFDAESAHRCVFPEENEKENKLMALSYASTAIAKCTAAQALYFAKPELESDELPKLFHQFDVFVHELQTDYERDHSVQWVDIEFNTLKEQFDQSACASPITE